MPFVNLFDRERFPLLMSLLDDARFTFVDIGGRRSAFSPLLPLAPFARYVSAEPDRDETERLTRALPERVRWRDVTVLSEAIASRNGDADLYVTKRAGMSSLLPPNHDVTRRYCLHSKFEVTAVRKVRALPLDEAAARYEFDNAAFLKLDTQGTELEILKSGPRLVAGPVVGIYVEASFHSFYRGQALFGDVDGYLRDNGFALFSLSRTLLRRSGYHESLYSKRVITWAHCLYFREPETLPARVGAHTRFHLVRLLGLALAFEFYDLAFEIVAVAEGASCFSRSELSALPKELGAFCRAGTRHRLRHASQASDREAILAPSFRDTRHGE